MTPELMTRAQWEERCRQERIADQERQRIEALRGIDLIDYLVKRVGNTDPITAYLLKSWQARASKNTAAALSIRTVERHGMTAYQVVADITLANGMTAYASEAITGMDAYQLSQGKDDLLWEHIIRHIVHNACGQLETALMPTFIELAGPQI